MLAALCAVLGYLVAQPLYYAAIALAAAALVLLIVAANGRQRAQQASAALGKLLRSYGAQDADGIYYQAEVHRAAYRACAAVSESASARCASRSAISPASSGVCTPKCVCSSAVRLAAASRRA